MSALQERLQAEISDRYAIDSELGRGGMAVVYLAEDLRNHRRVAIKVLEPAIATAIGTARFVREIEIAAGLIHPHILPLFDSGDAAGLLFYVMPYLEGDSLRARLDHSGALELNDAINVTSQIGSALTFAHQQGFVHRDIKPENILLQGDTAYLADFGIALALRTVDQDRVTSTGLSLGTPAYMSPEQASGARHIDHRSDIYSLGSVLYEMLTGTPPFEGAVRAVVARILTENPLRPRAIRPAIPESIEQAVLRAMAKMPADRFRNATDFVAALQDTGPPSRAPRLSRRTGRLAGLAVALAILAATGWRLYHHPTPTPDARSSAGLAGQFSSIGVLPFSDQGSDSSGEYLSDGLPTDLIERLAEVPGLKVAARTSAFSFKKAPQSLHDIANKLNVDAVLEGSVARTADSIRVTARLMDGGSELQIWSGTYARTAAEVSSLENELLQGLVKALGHEGPARPVNATAGAYDAYLKGRYHYEKYDVDEVRRSLLHFTDAVNRDPAFALGYAGLSDAYYQLSTRWIPADQAMPRAKAAAQQALTLDPDLAQGHIALARVQAYWEYDWNGAAKSLRQALAIKPGSASAHESYGLLLMFRGKSDSALAELRLAREYDPLSAAITIESVWPLLFGGRLDEAAEAYRQTALVLEMNMDASLGEISALQGDYPKAIQLIETYTASHTDMDARYFAVLARSYHATGREKEAQAILADLLTRAPERDFGNSYMLAMLYTGLGDRARALDWLERCDSVRNENIILSRVDPELAQLRDEPRYQAVLKRIGLD